VGTGLRYVWDDVFTSVGIKRTPVAYRREARFPWRVARKLVRMTVLRGLLAMAPMAGSGEAIYAMFQKGTNGHPQAGRETSGTSGSYHLNVGN
jgi:hypothetical protein